MSAENHEIVPLTIAQNCDLLEKGSLPNGIQQKDPPIDKLREVTSKLIVGNNVSKRRNTIVAKTEQKRCILKDGLCNVLTGNVAKKRQRYFKDVFTTLVDIKWRWTLFVFSLSFLIIWTVFALIWWLIAHIHGDLDYLHLADFHPELAQNVTHSLCVTEVRGLITAFLFSIEMQFTIGYGNRYVTEECYTAILTMSMQCILGVFLQAFMVGIIFSKMSRPKKRAKTLLFSRNAVISERDGQLALMFRVADIRKSHIIDAHVSVKLIRRKVTQEDEILPLHQEDLCVGSDDGEERLLFIWPTTIVHQIDSQSPLFGITEASLLQNRFEIICTLEGVIESTGMSTHTRTSYISSEILWGHRFTNLVDFNKQTATYEVDYDLFSKTFPIDAKTVSFKEHNKKIIESSSSTLDDLECSGR